ncbi:hypothetical protein ACN080_09565, partial [Rothia sp. CCM 9416]
MKFTSSKYRALTLGLVTLSLAACSTAPGQPGQPTASASASPSATSSSSSTAQPTATASPSPSASPSSTEQPTATAEPSETGSPQPTPSPSVSSSAGTGDQAGQDWVLKYQEQFDDDISLSAEPWIVDPLGAESPWYVDEFSDDGVYYSILGGKSFDRALDSMNIMRKRLTFGQDGWLTLELAAQDLNKDGIPDAEPSLTSQDGEGVLKVPAWNS